MRTIECSEFAFVIVLGAVGSDGAVLLDYEFDPGAANDVYWLDLASGSIRQLGVLAPQGAVFSTPDRRSSVTAAGLVALLDSTARTVELVDARSGAAQVYALTPPHRFDGTDLQLDDAVLRPDGRALLLTVVERYPGFDEPILARIFEHTLDDGAWHEIAPSDDPLEPHRSAPAYGPDGTVVYFLRTLVTEAGDGFETGDVELVRVDRAGELARVARGPRYGIEPVAFGEDGTVILELAPGAAPGTDNGVTDLYRWTPEPPD